MSAGLIFDLDGTLYPERQFIRSGFQAVAAEVARRYGVDARAAFRFLLATLRQGGRSASLQSLCLHFDLPPTIVPDLVQVIRAHTPVLHLSPGAADVLVSARAYGWRLGILTNGLPDVQARKVRALGLETLVDAVVYAQEWGSGRGKPDLEPFDVVRDRLGTAPSVTVYVGDDPWCDMYGARAAGLRTVLLRRGGPLVRASGAERVISSIDHVLRNACALTYDEVAHAA
jgi:putative hydrolase of the HAD superfamily